MLRHAAAVACEGVSSQVSLPHPSLCRFPLAFQLCPTFPVLHLHFSLCFIHAVFVRVRPGQVRRRSVCRRLSENYPGLAK